VSAPVRADRLARYTELIERERETLEELAVRVAEGESLWEICEEWAVPYGRFAGWIAADPRRQDIYDGARSIRADALADEIVEIADDETIDHQKAAVRIKARQWVATKWGRERYGEQSTVTVAVVDVREALAAARGRVIAGHAVAVIEAPPSADDDL